MFTFFNIIFNKGRIRLIMNSGASFLGPFRLMAMKTWSLDYEDTETILTVLYQTKFAFASSMKRCPNGEPIHT